MKAVMLMFDSLKRSMLEPYGCRQMPTPNFDRLAKRSVRFDNCYAGSLPCMPARRELHTGRYNFLHRSWGPLEPFDDSMPQILKDHGVYTHLISDHKHYWEEGGATYHGRYSSWEIIRGQEGDRWKVLPALFDPPEEAKVQNRDGQYSRATRESQRHEAVNRQFMEKEEDTALAQTVRHGLAFLDANHTCDGWFLQIECFDPHEPFYYSEDSKGVSSRNYAGAVRDWPPYHHVTEEPGLVKHYQSCYASLLTLCDRYLGAVLDKFDEWDLWKDTMLIVNTDHGYLLGEHGWWGKNVMPFYDEIAHIPLFIHDPRFSCDGTAREEIVQTIDLPATLLEYFDLPLPKDMQGRPIRRVIEEDQPIRDCALFGIHGAHVNLFDGRMVYMKAPATPASEPLNEYTLLPTHMRGFFSAEELRQAELLPGDTFSFTKGCPILRIPKGKGNSDLDLSDLLVRGKDSEAAKRIDHNCMVNAANFGDLLFDMHSDPSQEHPLDDPALEAQCANLLIKAMRDADCPAEQFIRLGFTKEGPVTAEDIVSLHAQEAEAYLPEILPEEPWEKGAVNAFRTLMRFIPDDRRDSACEKAAEAIADGREKQRICVGDVLSCVPLLIPQEYADLVSYYVELSGRTS